MSRKSATRLGALVALSLSLAFGLGLYIAGCSTGDIGNDLGLLEPGCRKPSHCFVTGIDCDCRYIDVVLAASDNPPDAGATNCLRPPAPDGTCVFDGSVAECLQPEDVCVGRAATTCDGVGARCVHANLGQTCAMSGAGDPPDQVATGAGGTLEQRCPYVDDTCCPGTIVPDAGDVTDGGDADAGF